MTFLTVTKNVLGDVSFEAGKKTQQVFLQDAS